MFVEWANIRTHDYMHPTKYLTLRPLFKRWVIILSRIGFPCISHSLLLSDIGVYFFLGPYGINPLYPGPRKEIQGWAQHQGPAHHLGKEKEVSSIPGKGLLLEGPAWRKSKLSQKKYRVRKNKQFIKPMLVYLFH